jgi:hypothetical protein
MRLWVRQAQRTNSALQQLPQALPWAPRFRAQARRDSAAIATLLPARCKKAIRLRISLCRFGVWRSQRVMIHRREEKQERLQPIYFFKKGTLAEVVRSYISTSGGYMKKLAFIVAVLAISAGPAIAQSQDDQAACTPDVMRLCQQDIPDKGRIIACLVRSKLQLSPACSGVFARARTAAKF